MIDKILTEKNFNNNNSFYILFLLGLLFLYIERKIIGINSTFHPDSAWYLNEMC